MIQRVAVFLTICLIILSGRLSQAQTPEIYFIDPAQSGIFGEVKIWGENFPQDISQLRVWFGAAEAEVTEVHENFLLVRAPLAATYEQVRVFNLANGLQASSNARFMLSFGGAPFELTAFEERLRFNSQNERMLDLTLVDLDGDALSEVVTTHKDGVNFSVFHNQSTADSMIFDQLSFSKVFNTTGLVQHADLDGDGRQDLIFFIEDGNGNVLSIVRNLSQPGIINFSEAKTIATPSRLRDVKANDLDGDGKPELILTSSNNNLLRIFKNTSLAGTSISFEGEETGVGIPLYIGSQDQVEEGSTGTVEIADLNNDQLPDLVANALFGNRAYVFTNESADGNLYFSEAQTIPFDGKLIELKTGDINGDNKLDLLATDWEIENSLVYVALNNSTTAISFEEPLSFPVFNEPWGLELADLDGDALLDVVVTSDNVEQIMYLRNTSTDAQVNFEPYTLPIYSQTQYIKAGDLNRDGKPDIAFTQNEGNQLTVIPNRLCQQAQILSEAQINVCPDVGLNLQAAYGAGLTYEWAIDGEVVKTSAESFIAVDQSGQYTVTTFDASNNCSSTSSPVQVNYLNEGTTPAVPEVNGITDICHGDSLILEAQQQANFNYFWEGPDGFTATSPTIRIPAMTAQQAGVYKLQVSIDGGCMSEVSEIPVTVASPPRLSIQHSEPTTFCDEGTVEMSVRFLEGFTYQWLKDGQPVEGATSRSYQATERGNFSVLTIDPEGCSRESEAVEVAIYPVLNVAFEAAANVCPQDSFSISNLTTGMEDLPVDYSWDFGDGNTSQAQHPTHAYQQAGTYTVQLTVSYDGACSQVDEVQIRVDENSIPPINVQWYGECAGDSAVLSLPSDYETYRWNTGESSSTITVKEDGDYSVQLTTPAGCSLTAELAVTFDEIPPVSVTSKADTILIGQSTQLFASGAAQYLWEPSVSLDDAQSASPLASPQETTTYTVRGFSNRGCSDSASFTLYVLTEEQIQLKAAKVLTPNGDNIHDTWQIENIELFPDNILRIFDKSGREIYRQQGYQNTFYGQLGGKELAQDAYYYILQYGEGKVQKGSFVLLR